MNVEQRVAVLQDLLARVQRKAAEPRVRGAVAPIAAPPTPVAAPAAPAQTPVSPSVVPVRASVAPTPVSAPPAQAKAPSPADQVLDELLEAPIPVVQTTITERPSVQPLSLRSPQPAPAVPVDLGPPAPAPAEEAPIPVVATGAAPAPSAEENAPEELGEDDLISIPPAAAQPSELPGPEITATPVEEEDIDFDEEEEEDLPASSQRPIAAEAAQAAVEHEVPIKTPPPESGPQEAAPPAAALEAPRLPEIREPLESETTERVDAGLTPEQLGDTIELPEPSEAPLELDVSPTPITVEEPPPVSEELEVALPRRESVGVYDDKLAPPADAREELRRYEEQATPADAASAFLQPSGVVTRPELSSAAVPRFVAEARAFAPKSFVELLDASLELGSD